MTYEHEPHADDECVQVVLADGSIINANAQQNTDLFWALKGGGPNFGKFGIAVITLTSA